MFKIFEEPESMDGLVYFTRRKIGDNGRAMAWVEREDCPECGKALMGKPRKDNGKVKVRAKKYVCEECGYEVPKKEYEETLTLKVNYTCPFCGHEGGAKTPYKRRTYKGAKSFVFKCEECNEKIPITKKMKAVLDK